MEQNYLDCNFEDDSVKQKWHPISACQAMSENDHGCFECNICFDSVQDPVVTFCGHLYCWPCIYKWIHVQNSPAEGYQKQSACPVCKANISAQSLVPLYGRGKSSPNSEGKKTNLGLHIPRRPAPTGLNTSVSPAQLLPNYFYRPSESVHHSQHYPHTYWNYTTSFSSNPGGTAMNGVVHPFIGLFGEMVYARIFGGSDASLFAYPQSSALTGSNSSQRRMRRQEMKLERSLNRLSVFLLCCIILCLVLF